METTELRSCVKVEVAVLGSPSQIIVLAVLVKVEVAVLGSPSQIIVLTVLVEVKQH